MENYTVKSNGTSLSIDTKGAQISSLKIGGLEYIWQRGEEWNGSAPILFPIVGELKGEGKSTIIKGKPYHITIHGFAGKQEYFCETVSEDEVIMSFESNQETRRQYPYDYKFSVKFKVFDGGFKQTFIIENKSPERMPYIVGAHPGFRCPLFSGDKFEDYKIVFEKNETAEAYRIDVDGLVDDSKSEKVFENGREIPLKHSIFDTGALLFEKLNSKSVKLINKNGKGVRMDYPDFDYFGIWKMKSPSAEYVCLEPWTGMNDCYSEDGIYEHKKGIRYIEEGRSVSLEFTVTAI